MTKEGQDCPKCKEFSVWRPRYCYGSPISACSTIGEHLHLACSVCGFAVMGPCADATPTP